MITARLGRVWEVYRPFQNAEMTRIDGRPLEVARLGLYAFWLLVPTAIAGGFVLRRRRVSLLPLVAMVLLVTATAATAYGGVRFRIPAEVAMIAAAGVAIDAGISRLRGRWTDSEPTVSFERELEPVAGATP